MERYRYLKTSIMECEVCLRTFDHSKFKPYVLNTCAHTACISCISQCTDQCPLCETKFSSKNPNWSLLQLVPDSNYDKLKNSLKQTLIEVRKLKKDFNLEKNRKLEENTRKINKLKTEIYERFTEIINLIQLNRDKMIEQSKHLETYLSKRMNHIRIDETKLNQIELTIDSNEYNEADLVIWNQEATENKLDTIKQIKKLESFNNSYQFIHLKNKTIAKGEIGALMNQNWLLNPTTEEDLIKKGDNLAEQLKDYTRAIELYNKAIHLNPTSANAFNSKGNSLYKLEKYEEAITCFNIAIRNDSNYVSAYNNKGNCLYALNFHDNAMRQYTKAISLDPDYIHAYNGKGNALIEKKQYDNAIECFKKAIQIDPNYVYAYNGYANALFNNCDFDTALTYYNKALDLDPLFVHALSGKGNTLKEKKEYDLAIDYFNRTIQIIPDYMTAYHGIGDVLREKKEYGIAIEYYKKAVKINPDYVDAHYNMGLAYFEKNDLVNAFQSFDKAVEIDSRLKFNDILSKI